MKHVRVECLSEYVRETVESGRELMDGEDLAWCYGFKSQRAMNRVLVELTGKTYSVMKKELTARRGESR